MSVLVELSIFPLDKGESVSNFVARAVSIIKESGLPYELHAMGTLIEGEWDEVMAVVSRCFHALEQESNRVYLTLRADYRLGPVGRMQQKVASIKAKLE